MKVKICGITNWDEAKLCIDAGVDALGFLVGITHLAEDQVTRDEALEIIKKVPPFISTVAVTHLTDAAEVIDICRYLGVTTVQIHNVMTPENVKLVRMEMPSVKIIKTFHVDEQLSIETIKPFVNLVDAVLFDTKTEDRLGGTGITHDWNITSRISKEIGLPIILSGGLNSDNVASAIQKIPPLFAVDVNSGVETKGKKDFERVKKFTHIAKMS